MDERALPALLALQGLMGAVDTLLNHEMLERLPYRREARPEIGLHSLREANYAILFAGLGWFAWHGAAALFIAALLIAEVLITARDEAVENRIRVLPQNERVLHVFLTLNLGAILALSAPLLVAWSRLPTGLSARDFGPVSWLLSLLAAAAVCWSLRDFVAWRKLRRA